LEETAMSPAFAIEHGATSILGMVILGTIAYGTWRFGFSHMFNERIGRVVIILSVIDAVGLVCWQ